MDTNKKYLVRFYHSGDGDHTGKIVAAFDYQFEAIEYLENLADYNASVNQVMYSHYDSNYQLNEVGYYCEIGKWGFRYWIEINADLDLAQQETTPAGQQTGVAFVVTDQQLDDVYGFLESGTNWIVRLAVAALLLKNGFPGAYDLALRQVSSLLNSL